MTRACLVLASIGALLALPGCSSSSSPGPTTDASATDATADDATNPTDAGADAHPTTDGPGAPDSGETEAGSDAGPVACNAVSGCLSGDCCIFADASTCGINCACGVALGCAYASQCGVKTDVCCIQQSTNGCTAGTWASTCLPTCNGAGSAQLCNPASANECTLGTCSDTPKVLAGVNLPPDAGFGVCVVPLADQ
jgi:hypothetical protein